MLHELCLVSCKIFKKTLLITITSILPTQTQLLKHNLNELSGHIPYNLPVSEEKKCRKIAATKRIFDLLISIPLFILCLPLMGIIYILVWIFMGKPVIFKQVRMGWYGKPFMIYKFRTMTDERDEKGNLLPDHMRITRLGKILRSLRLDELPQLINVIKGDLSLIGPRPVPPEIYESKEFFKGKRTFLRPGITGLAQIEVFNREPWSVKVKYDIKYIDNWNLFLDIKIVLLTPPKVIREFYIAMRENENTGPSEQTRK